MSAPWGGDHDDEAERPPQHTLLPANQVPEHAAHHLSTAIGAIGTHGSTAQSPRWRIVRNDYPDVVLRPKTTPERPSVASGWLR